MDVNSIALKNDTDNPFLSSARTGNYALRPGSPANKAGRALPADVARAIGVTNRPAPNLGALLLPGGAPVTP